MIEFKLRLGAPKIEDAPAEKHVQDVKRLLGKGDKPAAEKGEKKQKAKKSGKKSEKKGDETKPETAK